MKMASRPRPVSSLATLVGDTNQALAPTGSLVLSPICSTGSEGNQLLWFERVSRGFAFEDCS